MTLNQSSLLKRILVFAVPFLISNLLQTIYGMADLLIIGQFNEVASSTGVSIGSQIMHMITVMIIGLAMGTTVLISQNLGAKRFKAFSTIISNTVLLFVGVSVLITILLLLNLNGIVTLMQTPYEAVGLTRDYLFICFLGIPFITAYNVIGSIYRGFGDSRTPMIFVAITCLFNVVLDYILIGPFGMNTAGAALATISAQALSVLIALIWFSRQKETFHVGKIEWKLSLRQMGSLLKIGGPVCLQDGFIQISFVLITIFANMRGLIDATAVGIVEKVIGLLFLVPSAMLQTVSVLGAQNVGAKDYYKTNQVLYYSLVIAILWGIGWVVIMAFFAEAFVSLFIHDEQVVLAGGTYMRGYVWDCLAAGIHFCLNGYLYAYGYSGISFIENSLSMILARVPLAYMASIYFPATLFPMGIATTVGSVLSIIICVITFLWINKKTHTPIFKEARA